MKPRNFVGGGSTAVTDAVKFLASVSDSNVDENTSSGDEEMLRVGANFSRTGVNRLIRKQIGGATIEKA